LNIDSASSDLRKVVMLGSGGHAKVLSDALLASGISVKNIVDPYFSESYGFWNEISVLDDADLLKLNPTDIVLVNGVGSIPPSSTRERLYTQFKNAGFQFLEVVHPTAVLGSVVQLDEGVQIMAGVIIQAGSKIGNNTIINTGARVDHDCKIGSNVHIAPGVVACGGVFIGDHVHIGTGAVIVQGVSVGEGAVIGAGAVVLKDVPEHHKLLGNQPRSPMKLGKE